MMGNVQHITSFFDIKWQDCPYFLWKSAKKGLILRNTGFIITGPIICLFVEGRQSLDKQNICQGQVIEDFINRKRPWVKPSYFN